jgi:hypothetical protein
VQNLVFSWVILGKKICKKIRFLLAIVCFITLLVDDSVRSGTGYQKTHNRNMYMNVHIISSDVYLNGMAREQNGTYERGIMYGTERDGEKRNGLGTYSNVFIILVTVYGAERGIRRLIIEICT